MGVSLVFKRVKEESDRLESLLERARRYVTKDFSSPYYTLKNKVGIHLRVDVSRICLLLFSRPSLLVFTNLKVFICAKDNRNNLWEINKPVLPGVRSTWNGLRLEVCVAHYKVWNSLSDKPKVHRKHRLT